MSHGVKKQYNNNTPNNHILWLELATGRMQVLDGVGWLSCENLLAQAATRVEDLGPNRAAAANPLKTIRGLR